MVSNLRQLQQQLGYQFSDESKLTRALTHRSAMGKNNERLEFVGDAILSFIIAQELYERFENAKEGQLSRIRATLVQGDTLCEIAKEIAIGPHIRLGQGEARSGGHKRVSILADTLEAIIAAIYYDAGTEACRKVVLKWYAHRLNNVSLSPDKIKDAKTRLQELLQAQKRPLPKYFLIKTSGKAHAQSFTVGCQVSGHNLVTQGEGSSRRRAEQAAAEVYITRLKEGL